MQTDTAFDVVIVGGMAGLALATPLRKTPYSMAVVVGRARTEEVVALQSATDGLQRLFGASSAPLTALRNAGLNLAGHLPVLRDALVRYAAG